MALAVLVAVVLSGCSGGPQTQEGYVAGRDGLTLITPDKRAPATDVVGPSLHDRTKTVSLSDYRGRVVVVNVWGSWCAPCRAEATDLVAAAQKTADRAAFVGINTRDLDPAPAQAFVRSFGVTYDSIYDPKGELLLKFRGLLTPNGIPTTLVLDTQGRVAARVVGTVSESTLVGLIDDVKQGK